MTHKILFASLLCFLSFLAPIEAQTAPLPAARVKGRIIVARVNGQVNAVSKVNGQIRVLRDGDQVSDQTQIVTSAGADVILVFSNGATLNIAARSTLDIEEFEQDPFASNLKISDMKAEPGTSVTKLSLTKGDLVGKVVHLNVDKGSEFVVNTPVGAAGIRGTTFRIVFRPGPNGKALLSVTTADGVVVFKGITSGPVDIAAGKQVVATFDYTAPSPGNPGSTAQTGPVEIVTTDVSAAELGQIESISEAIEAAITDIVWTTGTGGGGVNGGFNGNDNNNTFLEPIDTTLVSPSS